MAHPKQLIYDPWVLESNEYWIGTGAVSTTSSTGANLRMFSTLVGTGAGISTVTTGVDNRLGVIGLSTGTTATGLCMMATGSGTGATTPANTNLRLQTGFEFYMDTIFRVPIITTGVEAFSVLLGWSNGSPFTDGAAIILDAASNTFIGRARNNNTDSVTPSMGTAVADQWYRARVNLTPASATFQVNNGTIQTLTTNLPTSTRPFGFTQYILKAGVGVTARTLQIDHTYTRIRAFRHFEP